MTKPVVSIAVAGGVGFAIAAAGATTDLVALTRLAVCGAALAAAAAVDVAEHRVPNRVVVPAATICAALTLADGPSLAPLASGLALVALMLGLSLARPAALGMGDVKLALLIALGLVGHAPSALLLGLALATLAGVVLVAAHGREAWRRALPLAPFFAVGALGALVL
jgi:leader peptidase (prepilin peptidase) / N-methyltransferase